MKRKANILHAGLLLVIVAVSYIPAVQSGFIWDDDSYVTDNPTLKTTNGLGRIWGDVRATPQYYPLVHTSYWIESRIWGTDAPAGFHIVNIVMHAVSAVLLWLILMRLRVPGAYLAAAIFAAHPVMVESVAWITERKNVLSCMFYLGAMLCYVRFGRLDETLRQAQGGPGPEPAPRWRWYAPLIALFVCALLSKTVTASLPAAALLLLWWKRGRIGWRDLWPVLPLLALGVAFGLLTASLEKEHVGAIGPAWDLTWLERVLIAGRAVGFYAWKLIWPVELCFNYPRWQVDAGQWASYLWPGGALATVVVLWLGRSRWGRGPLVAALFFVGTLVPALGFFNVYPFRYAYVADHFQYHASIGLIVLAAGIGATLLTRYVTEHRVVLMLVGGALIIPLGMLTWRQADVYEDPETLWRHTIEQHPTSFLANNNLGTLRMRQYHELTAESKHLSQQGGRHQAQSARRAAEAKLLDAQRHLEYACASEASYKVEAYNNLGRTLVLLRKPNEAIWTLRQALAMQAESSDRLHTLRNLAAALMMAGQTEEGLEQLRLALQQNPTSKAVHDELALALFQLAAHHDPARRNGALALRVAERVCLDSEARDPGMLDVLAMACAEVGRFDDAVAAATRAAQLAQQGGLTALADGINRRIKLYRAGKPYRMPAATQPAQARP